MSASPATILAAMLTDRTQAPLIHVHYGGLAADMTALRRGRCRRRHRDRRRCGPCPGGGLSRRQSGRLIRRTSRASASTPTRTCRPATAARWLVRDPGDWLKRVRLASHQGLELRRMETLLASHGGAHARHCRARLQDELHRPAMPPSAASSCRRQPEFHERRLHIATQYVDRLAVGNGSIRFQGRNDFHRSCSSSFRQSGCR
jgi:hypothetical protein